MHLSVYFNCCLFQELEGKVQPIISKLYKDAGGGAEEAPTGEEKDEL